MRLKGGLCYDPVMGFVQRELFIEGDTIADAAGGEELDVSGCYVIPGLTDLHFHGCMGADCSDGDLDGFRKMADFELSRGVTQMCPAGMTLPAEELYRVCRTAAQFRDTAESGAELAGINLEGPFLSEAKKGAQNGDYLQKPDVEVLKRLIAESAGLAKLVSIAPELEGAVDFIREASKLLTVSVAHTDCDYDEAMAAFNAGARQVTHLFNAMNPLHHRNPGPIAAAADSECMVELICDGVHIHPSVVRSVFRLFGAERVILISDTMRAAGMPDGEYTLGGQAVTVRGAKATLADGTLAGSDTDLMQCMVNAVKFGIPLHEAVTAAAYNPARAIGIDNRVGSLSAGKTANIAVLAADLSLKAVLMRGRVAQGSLD